MIRVPCGAPFAIATAMALLVVACGGSKQQPADANSHSGRVQRVPEVEATIAAFKAKDPTLEPLFARSAGYLVVPTIGEGAFIIGGGHGSGEAFERGAFVGTVSVSELSVGAQVGGQSYSELVFFETPADFQRLRDGTFEFKAEMTAIAAQASAAANSSFKDGVLAFVLPKKGLMASVAIGGQRLGFEPAE